jgi:hypothetical protein
MGNSTCRPSDFPNQDAMPFAVHQRKLLSAIIEKDSYRLAVLCLCNWLSFKVTTAEIDSINSFACCNYHVLRFLATTRKKG